jgi:hypothetical protein
MNDLVKDFEPTVEYELTIIKKETVIKLDGTNYTNTHVKGEDGEDIWDYVIEPPHVSTINKEVFKQTSGEVNVLSVVAAFNNVEFK